MAQCRQVIALVGILSDKGSTGFVSHGSEQRVEEKRVNTSGAHMDGKMLGGGMQYITI